MKWMLRHCKSQLPTVPDDAAERLGALSRSTDELRCIKAAEPEVVETLETVRQHLRRTPRVATLELAYAGGSRRR